MDYAKQVRAGSFWPRTLAGLAVTCLLSCEGTQREYARAEGANSEDDTAPGSGAGSGGSGNGLTSGSSGESTIVTQLQPAPGAVEPEVAAEPDAASCVEASTESCGPPREEGICKFGTRTCTAGAWGDCVGGVAAGSRDCTSAQDNDCDGQPDDTLDDVCRCPAEGTQVCEEHDGLDGKGQCRAGEQACVLGEGNLTSDWGPCLGSVGPGSADSCSVAGDDTNCDGVPNGGCTCVEGAMQPCGPDTDVGICQRGVSTCINGAFGACQGAVFQGRRDCSSALDNDCDGRPDNTSDATCTCVIGAVQACGTHPGRDGNGPCRAGQQTCEAGAQNVASRFGACNGSVGPAQRDSCTAPGDDADCNGTANSGCQCVAGQSNAPCSGDANNSRCSPQGTCAPCQANADCSLVSGGRSVCSAGSCVTPGLTVQRFSWTSRQAPTMMGTTQGRACFLTRVGGQFDTAVDSVQIVTQGGQWVLTGAADPVAANAFVEARAACVAAPSVTAEVSVLPADDGVNLQSTTTHACFLTRVAGNFQGGAENVQLSIAGGFWRLGSGAESAAGVQVSARCMPVQPVSENFLMAFSGPSPLVLDPELSGVCYLTRVSGELNAEGDLVETEWNGANWELRRAAGSTLQAAAACFGRNGGAGVPAVQ